VLNAANEVAVAAFLRGDLGFTDIASVITETMDAHVPALTDTLAFVRRVDDWARTHAADLVRARAVES
jgi:1-deoxy-D-xylulose-5-phosphate reductoisomerase